MASIAEHGQSAVKRTTSQSSGSSLKEKDVSEPAVFLSKDPESDEKSEEESKSKYRPFILGGLALLILGWWISATILEATRHRW